MGHGQIYGGKAYFTHVSVQNATPNTLSWINAQLKRDGYAPIP